MNSAASFNIVDIVAVLVVLLCVLRGLRRGLIGLIGPIVAFIVVAIIAWFGFNACHDWLTSLVNWEKPVVWMVTFILVIILPFAIMMTLVRRLGEVMKLPVLASLDRLGGAIAGFVGGAVLVFLLVLALTFLPATTRPEAVGKGSWVTRRVMDTRQEVVGIVTQELGQTQQVLIKARERKEARGNWDR